MKLRYSSTVLAVLAAASLPAMAATIATVNGVAISSNRADALIAEQKAQGPRIRSNCAMR